MFRFLCKSAIIKPVLRKYFDFKITLVQATILLFSSHLNAGSMLSVSNGRDTTPQEQVQCRDVVETSLANEVAIEISESSKQADTLFEHKWRRVQDYFASIAASPKRSETDLRNGLFAKLSMQDDAPHRFTTRSSSWSELRARLTLESAGESRTIKVANSDFVFKGGVLLRRNNLGKGSILVIRFNSIKLMERSQNLSVSAIGETGSVEPKPLAYLGRAKGLDRRFFRVIQALLFSVKDNLLLHPEIEGVQISGEEVVNPFLRELLVHMGFKEFSDEDYERETGILPLHSYLRSYILHLSL